MSTNASDGKCSTRHLKLALTIILPTLALVAILVKALLASVNDDVEALCQALGKIDERVRAVEKAAAGAEKQWDEVQRSLSRIEKQLERRPP